MPALVKVDGLVLDARVDKIVKSKEVSVEGYETVEVDEKTVESLSGASEVFFSKDIVTEDKQVVAKILSKVIKSSQKGRYIIDKCG